jgi:hypothetical protein
MNTTTIVLLVLSTAIAQVLGILQIDCLNATLTDKECIVLIYNTIGDFTGSLSDAKVPKYFAADPPWEFNVYTDSYYEFYYYYPGSGETLQKYALIYTQVVVSSLSSIDAIAGTMTTSGVITYLWNDHRLAWNETLAPCFTDEQIFVSSNSISIPIDWIWTPSVFIFNGVDVAYEPSTTVHLYPNGVVRWVISYTITSSCELDLVLYPFDTQTCPIKFKTDNYIANSFRLFEAIEPIFSPQYSSSPTWETLEISSSTEEILNGPGKTSQYNVYIKASRYTYWYYTTAIVPNIICVIIAICSLFIQDVKDFGPRLGNIITVLLTEMAILWSISTNLPISSGYTWLERFVTACVILVFGCTVESCIFAAVAVRNTEIPLLLEQFLHSTRSLRHQIYKRIYCLRDRNDVNVSSSIFTCRILNCFNRAQVGSTIYNEGSGKDVELANNISETASLKSGKRSIRTTILVNGRHDTQDEVETEIDLAELHSVYWTELAFLIDFIAHIGFSVTLIAILCRYFSEVVVF